VSTDRILTQWPAQGPQALWRKAVTDGFSSFAVSQGRAYTLVKRTIGGQALEVCLALNADTGAELWASPVGQAKYDPGAGDGDGPRSTPSIRGDRAYVLSAYLVLYCLNTADGQVVWSKDLVALYGGSVILWQNAASPLIEGDLILVNCNGKTQRLLALRASDGSEVWKGQTDKMTQATPVAATILGVRQVIFFAQSGLVSVVSTNGQVLWRYAFPYSTSTAASPVVAGDIVYCSASYGEGAGAVRITKTGSTWKATQIWRKPGDLENHWSTPVHYNGFLYGLFGAASSSNPLKCVDVATGQEQWSVDGFGPGGVLVADGKILVLSENGQLVLVEPDPAAYRELARYQAVAGKCWNVPAVSNGRIYARSIKEAVCLDVAAPPPPRLRLLPPVCQTDGRVQLQIANVDGSSITAERLGGIEVYATSAVQAGLGDWAKLTSPLVLTNGVLRLDSTMSAAPTQRYFVVLERL
jgi:outer membrane protein assembly factor BamB